LIHGYQDSIDHFRVCCLLFADAAGFLPQKMKGLLPQSAELVR
jgi:hypothetical protein